MGTALTPPLKEEPPPMIASTADCIPNSSTDNSAVTAMSWLGLKYGPPEACESAAGWGGGEGKGGNSLSSIQRASTFLATRAEALVLLDIL